MNWTLYPNFKAEEFRCKHTGKDGMHPDFMARLQALRNEYGKGMKVTSGYRDKLHPIEAKKQTTGAHTTGRAVDIAVEGADAIRLLLWPLNTGSQVSGCSRKVRAASSTWTTLAATHCSRGRISGVTDERQRTLQPSPLRCGCVLLIGLLWLCVVAASNYPWP
jgi:zinc D-Ala-D-Ala carboxypeptidase